MLKIRCSSLGKIMTLPKKKEDKLSVGAKTYIRGLVKQELFKYKPELSTKELEKGNAVEDDCIELYNEVHTTFYVKNTTRLSNDYIEGECDIDGNDIIIDIKAAWSAETFPATPEEIKSRDYEYQVRGYMWLYNKPKGQIAYCLTDTPSDLILDWYNEDIHIVNHIDPMLRVTKVNFERDKEKEDLIIQQVKYAREYYDSYMQQLLTKN